jgi:hypothetical protein
LFEITGVTHTQREYLGIRRLGASRRSFRVLLWRGVTFHSILLLFSGTLFLVVRDFVFEVRGRRDEGANGSRLSNPVGAVLTLGDEDRILVGTRITAKAVEGVEVQVLIPGAGNAQRHISSSTGR